MIAGTISIELAANVARISRDMEQARRVVGNATASMERAANVAKNALASIGAGIGLSQIIQMSDQYAKFTAQLRLATQSQREYGAAYADVKRISTSAQQDLQATGMLYARIANGTRELGTSQKQVAAITETVNMALKVSGATTAEAASAQLQLSQAFASGTLRGEEFNAVNEAAPRLMKALADGMGVPVGALKAMATEGQITSKIMADVLPRALEDLRNEAKEVQTIAGAFTVLKNNVMEFVGVQANASGGVAMLTGAIALLASNLGLLAGVMLTVGAAKLGAAIGAWTIKTYEQVAASVALRAATIASAQSTVAEASAKLAQLGATQAMIVVAREESMAKLASSNASIASAQTAMAAASAAGAQSFALRALKLATVELTVAEAARAAMVAELAILGQQQARVSAQLTVATAAQAAAQTGLNAATGLGGAATGIAARALGFLGGPIGAIITLLGLGATAWAVWGNKAKEGNDLAKESAVEASTVIIAELDKQIEKNQRIIEMRKQGATFDQANKNLKNTAALGALGNDLASLNRGDGQYSGMSNDDKFFAREKIMKSILDLQGKIALAETTGAAAKALTQAEARNKFMGEYATKQEQMNAKLKEARDLLGTSFTAEDEARIRKHYEVKAAVSKVASKVESEADKARLKAAKEIADAAAEAAKVQADYAAKLGQTVAEANREAAANEELVRTYGMSKAAIEAENIARLEAQVERLRGIDMADDEIAALELVIAAKKRSAAALGNIEQLDQVKRINDQIDSDYKDTAKSIRDSLTDGLMRGFESGKSFGRNLIDTLRNMFKTLVLQPTIQGILAPVAGALTGALGVAGTAQAATGGGGGGVGTTVSGLGMLGSLTSGAGLLGAGGLGLQAGFGALMSGGLAGVSAAVSGGIAAIGAGTGASIAAGMGTIAGALGPIALGIGAAVVLLNKAFGRGPKEVISTTMNGTFGANGFSGTTDAAWKKEGGWLRSDKTGVDKTAIDAAVAKEFSAGYDAIKAASTDFANVLGLNAESIKNRSQSLSIALTKDGESNKKAIADFFTGIGNTIASELLPTLSEFTKEGEGASATLQRLATNYTTIDAALSGISLTFGVIGVESLAARERLVTLSGGIEALVQNAAGFAQNYLTEAERLAPVASMVAKSMADLGFASTDTRDEFKALVQSLDLTTESGATNYAALMKLQGAFAEVAKASEVAADAAIANAKATAAAAIESAKASAAGLITGADDAFGVLQRVSNAEKDRLTKAHEVAMKRLQIGIDTETAAIAKTRALSDSIKSTISQISGGPDRATAQAQIQTAIAMAKAGGVLPSADSLKDALSVLSRDSGQFATLQEFQRDQYQTQNSLAELGKLTDSALSVEERTLAALEAQKEAAQAAYEGEIGRLDEVVSAAQSQIDILKGIDTTGLTIVQALEALRTAILSAQGNSVAGSTSAITDAYKSALGRMPDSGGLAYFQDRAAAGASVSDIVSGIKNSPEAQVQAAYKELLGRNADAGGLDYFLKSGGSIEAIRAALMQSDEYKKKLRGFAVGTNRVPYDMDARVHEDERIIPAADNRALMAMLSKPAESGQDTAAAFNRLTAEFDGLRAEARATAIHTAKMAKLLDRVINNDKVKTEVAA